MDILDVSIILLAGLLGYSFAGVAGFGGGVMLMPTLTIFLGPHAALPTLCFCSIFATASRSWLNRAYIDWKVNLYFLVGAIPLTILGTRLFISLEPSTIERILGIFILVIVISKQLPAARHFKMKLWGFIPLGGVTAFIAGVAGVPGPFTSVFFLNYGLQRMAFIGTFAFAMGSLQIPKLAVFALSGFIHKETILLGTGIGIMGIIASYFGTKVVRKVPDKFFTIFINLVLVVFAIFFILK